MRMRGVRVEQKLGPLSIWEWPVPGDKYVIGADVAEGKVRDLDSRAKREMIAAGMSEKPDYHCAIVLTEKEGRHVATWHGWCDAGEYAIACMAVGYLYNTALIASEQNGPGIVLLQEFVDKGYPRIYQKHRLVNRVTGDLIEGEIGWRTTPNTRPLLINAVAAKIKEDPDCTRDVALLNECRTMEINPTDGQARARGRNKDDRVLAWGIGLYARNDYLTRGEEEEELDPLEGLDSNDRQVWLRMEERQRRAAHERTSRNRDFGAGFAEPGGGDLARVYGAAADLLRQFESRQRSDHRFGPSNW